MPIKDYLEKRLKSLSDKPGVYLMRDSDGDIIYVGKAKNLKNRIRQYFQNSNNHPFKIQVMINHIDNFEYIITDTETEALVLECNLIKKHKPRYNVLLKDDKTYPYIKITINEDFPRIIITRNLKKDGAKYFGPYTNVFAVKDTVDTIKKLFLIRTCNRQLPKDIGKSRPCLNYYINQCSAPCQGIINKKDYGDIIDKIISFLSGKQDILIGKIRTEMHKASKDMDFEKAAKLRDQLNSINQISQRQKVVSSSLIDQDIIALELDKDIDIACIQVFFIRNGKLIGREHFIIDNISGTELQEIQSSFVKQFYNSNSYIPKEIILQYKLNDMDTIQKWLTNKRGNNVYIINPQKGEKKSLLEMVYKNALETLNTYKIRKMTNINFLTEALEQLQEHLSLKAIPKRVEAYDISNIAGSQSVGAMVVYKDAKPYRDNYRRFKIKTVTGSDDYESMREVLFRRFNAFKKNKDKSFSMLPDLILLDGGRGHVHAIKQVLSSLNLYLPVFGMVKDDKHKTCGLVTEDKNLQLPTDGSAFKLISQIQEEVHRVAIGYHRKLRSKEVVKSELDKIKGIGNIRKKSLLMHFKSIDRIKEAKLEQLESVESMNKTAALNVFNYFRQK